MTLEDVYEKFFPLLNPVLGRERARRLIDSVLNLEKVRDARSLRTLLRA